MKYLYLIVVVFLISLQNTLKKDYNRKTTASDTFYFSFFATLGSMMFFLISSRFQPDFCPELLPYSTAFGLSFAFAMAGSFTAIRHGSLSITMLVSSYSLVIPTFYGVFALNDEISISAGIGIVLLLISLFLINKKSENKKSDIKWLTGMIFSFLGNGLCSVILKLEQLKFNGGYKNEFMLYSLAISALILLALAVYKKESLKRFIGAGIYMSVLCGTASGAMNYLVMVLTATINNSILFPTMSAGGIVIGFILAVFLYKEKLSRLQLTGYFMGVLSVILLNI